MPAFELLFKFNILELSELLPEQESFVLKSKKT